MNRTLEFRDVVWYNHILMILTVTPNAAIDRTYCVEDFGLNRVHRPSSAYQVAGGKGVNVARVTRTLGGEALATGFLGGAAGRFVRRALAAEGIPAAFTRVAGESRTCIAIVDPNVGTQTEINELGPEISPAETRALRNQIARHLSQQRFDFVVLCGSLPPGAPTTLYAELIVMARRERTPAVLDTSGEALRVSLEARPWMVKPNRAELESLCGVPLRSREETLEAARQLRAQGIETVVATRGAEGALLVTATGDWEAVPPPIRCVSAVASGDTFLAAFLFAWTRGERPGDPESALKLAAGAGAANAEVAGAGFCSREAIYRRAAETQVREL